MSRWKHPGLQLRMMAYVTLGLLALLGGLGYFDLQAIRDTRDQVLRERTALAYSVAQDVVQDFAFLASDLELGAEDTDAPVGDYGKAADKIADLLRRHANSQFFRVSMVGVLNEQGQLLASSPPIVGEILPPDTSQVRDAIESNRYVVLASRRTDEAATPFAAVVVPVTASWTGGKPMAVVADTVGVSGLPPAIPGGGSGYSMEVLGVRGRTIISTSHPEREGQVSPYYEELQKYIDAGTVGAGVYPMLDAQRGHNEVLAVTPFPSGPFYLVLKQPAELALFVPRQRWNQMLAVGSAALMVMLSVAWYTTRRVVGPVRELSATARAFAQGNLDTPVRVEAQDELRDLARDVESMRQQLKKSRDEVERTNRELELKVADRTQRLQETLGKIMTAQEEERRRLARELHDEQSQTLGALAVSLDRISRLAGPGSSPEANAEIERAKEMARGLVKDTRRLIYDLRPSVLDDMGLEAAIRWCAETHLESHGVQVTLRSSLPPRRLPAAVEVALFRVAQEAMVNIERHAEARQAGVSLCQKDSRLELEVWDDGKGFAPSPDSRGDVRGVGLEGTRERVRLIGGKIEITSAPGKGTKVSIQVPLDQGC